MIEQKGNGVSDMLGMGNRTCTIYDLANVAVS